MIKKLAFLVVVGLVMAGCSKGLEECAHEYTAWSKVDAKFTTEKLQQRTCTKCPYLDLKAE